MSKCLIVILLILILGVCVGSSLDRVQHPEVDLAVENWSGNFESGGLYTGETSFIEKVSLPYTPLYYLVWFNINSSIITGQIISILSTILIVVLIYLISRIYLKNRLVRLIPSSLFLLSPTTMYWSTTPRSDVLALLFTLCGIYVYLKVGPSWSALLFVLAFFTKQTAIVAPLTIVIYGWIATRKFNGKLLVVYGLLLGLGLVLGQVYSGGNFLRHIFLFPVQSGGPGVLYPGRMALSALVTVGTNLGILGGLFIVLYRIFRERSSLFRDFLVTWFVVSICVMLVTIGKPGSGSNYGLECLIVGSLLTGIAIDKFLMRSYLSEI